MLQIKAPAKKLLETFYTRLETNPEFQRIQSDVVTSLSLYGEVKPLELETKLNEVMAAVFQEVEKEYERELQQEQGEKN